MKRDIQIALFVFLALLIIPGAVMAQDEQEEDPPIRRPFETVTLIDNHTTVNPFKGSFVLDIQHRFSQISEFADLFGIYGSANTRLGLSYGISDRIMAGFGTTRDYMMQDLEWKVSLLKQTRSGRIPVGLSYHGNVVLDARDNKFFGPEEDYNFLYRFSYLNQVIISRNFGGIASFLLAPTFVYYNAVPEGYRNTNASIFFGGRLMVLGFNSIIFEYDQPLLKADEEVYPNVALGVEIGTSTHAFRVFVSNYNAIIRNRSIAFNNNNPLDGDFQFGFNIAIRF